MSSGADIVRPGLRLIRDCAMLHGCLLREGEEVVGNTITPIFQAFALPTGTLAQTYFSMP